MLFPFKGFYLLLDTRSIDANKPQINTPQNINIYGSSTANEIINAPGNGIIPITGKTIIVSRSARFSLDILRFVRAL